MAGIVISPGFALSPTFHEDGWKPVIGWHTLINEGNIEASFEDSSNPASNLANPSTINKWKSTSTNDQYLRVMFNGDRTVDYVGIARHNLGSSGATVSIQIIDFDSDPDDPNSWQTIASEVILADDGPRMWRFVPYICAGVQILLKDLSELPDIAVLKIGKLLQMSEGIPPGYNPMNFAEAVTRIPSVSQSGDYLGTITSTSVLSTVISFQGLDPDWYRDEFEPFRIASTDENPFFWAWAPLHYPDEVCYAWVTGDIIPTITQVTGLIDVSFPANGIAI